MPCTSGEAAGREGMCYKTLPQQHEAAETCRFRSFNSHTWICSAALLRSAAV
jgi:hypothetical protein